MSRFPAAFPLPALASWSSCSRRGIGRSLRSAYQCARRRTGPRRGFRVSHARAAIGVGALSTPGTTVLALTGVAHRPALAASQRRVPALRHDVASMRSSALRSITKGSRVFTRPIFPLPVAPGCNGSVLGFTPSFAPRPCGRRTSRWGQVIEHGPETTLYVIDLASNPALISQCVRPRVARDDAEADATWPQQALGTRIDGTEGGDWREPGRALLRHPRSRGGSRPRVEPPRAGHPAHSVRLAILGSTVAGVVGGFGLPFVIGAAVGKF